MRSTAPSRSACGRTPSLIERARRRVEDWLRDGTVARPYTEAWREVLAGTVDDRDYVRAAVRHRLADRATLLERLAQTPISEDQRGRISRQIEADFAV